MTYEQVMNQKSTNFEVDILDLEYMKYSMRHSGSFFDEKPKLSREQWKKKQMINKLKENW